MTEEQSVKNTFVSLASRTKWVSILLFINITLALADIHFLISAYSLYSSFKDGSFYSQNEVETVERMENIIVLLSFIVLLTTAFSFLVWIRRANINLKALGIIHPEYSPGWAVWGFFIPFVNLVRPYQVMKELWNSSALKDEESNNMFKNYSTSTTLLLTWWIVWIISKTLGNLHSQLSRKVESIDSYMNLTQLGIIYDITHIAAAVLCVFVVNEIKSRQELRYAQITSM